MYCMYASNVELGSYLHSKNEKNMILRSNWTETSAIEFLQCDYQVIPGHGDPQKSRTMSGGYSFKYCCIKCQNFDHVFENTCTSW